MDHGKKIKAARKAKGLTQKQLGDMLGVTGVTIMRYEKNLRQPRIDQWAAIAKALDINVYEMFSLDKEASNMKTIRTKTVVKAEDFVITPQELLEQLQKVKPLAQLSTAYARLMEDAPALAKDWADLVTSRALTAYIDGMQKGAELVAAAFPEAQDDPDFTVKLEVIVK